MVIMLGKMYTLINTICYNNIDENETGDIRRNNGDFTIYNCLATVVSPALAENFDSNGNILTTPADESVRKMMQLLN